MFVPGRSRRSMTSAYQVLLRTTYWVRGSWTGKDLQICSSTIACMGCGGTLTAQDLIAGLLPASIFFGRTNGGSLCAYEMLQETLPNQSTLHLQVGCMLTEREGTLRRPRRFTTSSSIIRRALKGLLGVPQRNPISWRFQHQRHRLLRPLQHFVERQRAGQMTHRVRSG